jgi:hypothetical protein
MDEDEEKKMDEKHQDINRKATKKGGISAEAYGEYHTLNDFVPKVIEKTEEQKK